MLLICAADRNSVPVTNGSQHNEGDDISKSETAEQIIAQVGTVDFFCDAGCEAKVIGKEQHESDRQHEALAQEAR